jgi:hypothetical protein
METIVFIADLTFQLRERVQDVQRIIEVQIEQQLGAVQLGQRAQGLRGEHGAFNPGLRNALTQALDEVEASA